MFKIEVIKFYLYTNIAGSEHEELPKHLTIQVLKISIQE
jgi:hypothetical protein